MRWLKTLILVAPTLAVVAAQAPLIVPKDGEPIPNSYIVILKPETVLSQVLTDVTSLLRPLAPLTSLTSHAIGAFQALVGNFDNAALEVLRRSPFVDRVEQDVKFKANAVQEDAPWGLVRISHRDNPIASGIREYVYDPNGGAGQVVYILDTGVNIKHEEFEGRARIGKTFYEGTGEDDLGHGTHVAGIVGGKTYGVAKKAEIVSVKVLGPDGSGSTSTIIAGLEWVNKNADKGKSVVNMSLGGPRSIALDLAVREVTNNNTIVVVAAGNSNFDSCFFSPAGSPGVISVAATQEDDKRASYSNFGFLCTTLFAPGTQIPSAWIGSTTEVKTISGTSMASPHVAGAVAVMLGREGPLTPSQVKKRLQDNATKNKVSDARSPNLLLFERGPEENQAQ
ncbi:uncharacterized protein VTP21DRAFT_5432 [Calcarisporiella thermophila]|uniref:uncharacterized protein n=1 Tax=Calcarisporiella thermophila TaxID=911321 RepID=UPI003744641B